MNVNNINQTNSLTIKKQNQHGNISDTSNISSVGVNAGDTKLPANLLTGLAFLEILQSQFSNARIMNIASSPTAIHPTTTDANNHKKTGDSIWDAITKFFKEAVATLTKEVSKIIKDVENVIKGEEPNIIKAIEEALETFCTTLISSGGNFTAAMTAAEAKLAPEVSKVIQEVIAAIEKDLSGASDDIKKELVNVGKQLLDYIQTQAILDANAIIKQIEGFLKKLFTPKHVHSDNKLLHTSLLDTHKIHLGH